MVVFRKLFDGALTAWLLDSSLVNPPLTPYFWGLLSASLRAFFCASLCCLLFSFCPEPFHVSFIPSDCLLSSDLLLLSEPSFLAGYYFWWPPLICPSLIWSCLSFCAGCLFASLLVVEVLDCLAVAPRAPEAVYPVNSFWESLSPAYFLCIS